MSLSDCLNCWDTPCTCDRIFANSQMNPLYGRILDYLDKGRREEAFTEALEHALNDGYDVSFHRQPNGNYNVRFIKSVTHAPALEAHDFETTKRWFRGGYDGGSYPWKE